MKRLLVFMSFALIWAILGVVLILGGYAAIGGTVLGVTGMVTAMLFGADFMNTCVFGGVSFFSDKRL